MCFDSFIANSIISVAGISLWHTYRSTFLLVSWRDRYCALKAKEVKAEMGKPEVICKLAQEREHINMP